MTAAVRAEVAAAVSWLLSGPPDGLPSRLEVELPADAWPEVAAEHGWLFGATVPDRVVCGARVLVVRLARP